MWRSITVGGVCAAAMLLAGCAGPPSAKQPAAAGAVVTASASPAPSKTAVPWTFTVSGSHPVAANGAQDTHAQAGGVACSSSQLAMDSALGGQIAAGFAAEHFPVSAQLLRHFLAGSGTPVSYPAGSAIAKLALASAPFRAVRTAVEAKVRQQLAAGQRTIRLSAEQLPLPAFSEASSDLYWGFRGTQGLDVSGSGTRRDGRYVGTLTFTIRDSYGFPVGDTLNGFGPPMRYLQTVCGAPQHAMGAHWFPDAITVTVPFH